MDVQPRELAGLQAVGGGGFREPVLPFRRYAVMADIGGIAEKEGRAVDSGKAYGAIVTDEHGQTMGQPERRGVRAQHRSGQRIDLDRDQRRVGERLCRSEKESTGFRARVDDARRSGLVGGPTDHGVDDRTRGVDGPVRAAGLRGAQPAESVAERIFAARDGQPGLPQVPGGRRRFPGRESALGLGQERAPTGQGGGEHRQLALRARVDHRLLPRRRGRDKPCRRRAPMDHFVGRPTLVSTETVDRNHGENTVRPPQDTPIRGASARLPPGSSGSAWASSVVPTTTKRRSCFPALR